MTFLAAAQMIVQALKRQPNPFANLLKGPKLHAGLNYMRKPQANMPANVRMGYFVGDVVGTSWVLWRVFQAKAFLLSIIFFHQ